MRNNIRKQLVQIASVILTLAVATAAHAVSQPIQTERGIVRLGSKTQAHVDVKQSTVSIAEGMVLVSSNPGRPVRPKLRVSFKGAPMHAKVQGTALIAYLSRDFIQITGVEGRTYLVREGRLGEVVAIDAGKMLLVKPTAKRLPDTVDINLSDFIENSPMLNGGLKLAASQLISRAIEKQSGSRYLKSTPIYFDGAGTEAVIAGGSPELPATGEGLGDEGTPLGTSLTGIDAIERIPAQVEGPQPVPEQLLVAQAATAGGGETTAIAGVNGTLGGGAETPDIGGIIDGPNGGGGPPLQDLPGAPASDSLVLNAPDDFVPARGFSEEFRVTFDDNSVRTAFFPVGFTGDKEAIITALNPGKTVTELVKIQEGALIQAEGVGAGGNFLVFKEANIKANPTFTIDPIQGATQIELRVSTQDIPSDLLTKGEFEQAFAVGESLPETFLGYTQSPLKRESTGIPNSAQVPDEVPAMKIIVPEQGVKFRWNGFVVQDLTTPAPPNALIAEQDKPGGSTTANELVGLKRPTLMGSAFVDVTSGAGVAVEVGDKRLHFPSTDTSPGIFSVQAPPQSGRRARFFRNRISRKDASGPRARATLAFLTAPNLGIKSQGPLHISDPTFGAMAGTTVTSKQDISVSAQAALVFSNTKLIAGQGIAVSSPTRIRFENSSELAALTAVMMNGGGTSALEVVNSRINARNGEILIDQFDRIQLEGAALMASIIRARVISPSGVLHISNSTLSADKLLRLYAEGASGMVEFDGRVALSGSKIDIAGKTVKVNEGGRVTTGPHTTVYADTRAYNKAGFGQFGNHSQGNFGERPSFDER